ncbi:hypothetical protein [Natrinema pellirubrum]|nr:hypothetical protein [Natrinema pellirubrum]
MDSIEAMHHFLLLNEYLLPEEPASEDLIREFIPASAFNQDWQIVLNPDMEEKEAIDIPKQGKTTMVRSTQALIFLGNRHAGLIGSSAGEFYDDRFDTSADLQEEFLEDLSAEFSG